MSCLLLCKGYEVVIVDNFVNSSPLVLDRLKKITGKDVVCFWHAQLSIVDRNRGDRGGERERNDTSL